MNNETYEALKRLMYHLRSYTKHLNDIDEETAIVESWIDEVAKEYQEDDNIEFNKTHTLKEIKEARQAVKDSNE